MNVLIDTNVVLDAILSREPHAAAAQKIFLLAAENKIHAGITANTVTDIHYLALKYLRDSKKVKEVLAKLFALFQVVDVTAYDCKKALDLPMDYYEDALLSICAKKVKCDFIVTRNINDFANSIVKPVLPNDFLKNQSK